MFAWLDDNKEIPEWDLRDPANSLIRDQESFAMWQLCQSTDWAHLPRAGGWDDQDDAFLHDAMIISRRLGLLRKRKSADRRAHEEAAKKMGIAERARRALRR